MDSRKSQTSTATPAQPGDFPLWFNKQSVGNSRQNIGQSDNRFNNHRKNVMAYREDKGLKFLNKISSKDLGDLVSCLTHDKDGSVRLAEELTASASYKRHYPDHHKYWKSIAAEIQCFGANSLATIFRGGVGVEYKEVLMDVCDKMKVNYNKDSKVVKIENKLLMTILSDAIEKMSPEDLRELAEETGIENTSTVTTEIMIGVFQGVFRRGGFKSYQLTVVIANAVLKAISGGGLTLAGNAALTRTMAILTGPIGWVITGLLTAVDIAGPAYRVTIPAVIQVAALRQKYLYEREAGNVENCSQETPPELLICNKQ